MNTITTKDKNISLPSDQYGRYGIVAEKIKFLMKSRGQKSISILDVGGHKGEIHKFFTTSEAKISIIDLFDSNEPNYVKGSALDMPFSNSEFDYVVSFEVFEHIPKKDRNTFIKECVRVSKNEFILTAPFSGSNNEVLNSEILVNRLWKKMHNKNHLWLYEHIQYGTPSEHDLEHILDSQQLKFRKYGNNDLMLWNLMVSFNYLTTLYRPSGLNPKIQEFYNIHDKAFDSNTNEHYRKIYVIGDGSERLKKEAMATTNLSEKNELTNELINKIFIAIATDIKKLQENHQRELNTVSSELINRIKIYDDLAAEHEELSKQLFKPISKIIGKKLKKIANRK